MPEFIKKENGEFDYQKFFMGISVAVVFVMQQYHAMRLADVKASVVPRAEYEAHRDTTMHRDDILLAITRLGERMDSIEGQK